MACTSVLPQGHGLRLPCLKFIGSEILDFEIFVYIMRYVSSVPHIHNLEVISYNIFTVLSNPFKEFGYKHFVL